MPFLLLLLWGSDLIWWEVGRGLRPVNRRGSSWCVTGFKFLRRHLRFRCSPAAQGLFPLVACLALGFLASLRAAFREVSMRSFRSLPEASLVTCYLKLGSPVRGPEVSKPGLRQALSPCGRGRGPRGAPGSPGSGVPVPAAPHPLRTHTRPLPPGAVSFR